MGDDFDAPMSAKLAELLIHEHVRYPGWQFRILRRAGGEFAMQGHFEAADGWQKTRKWRLSRYMTKSEIVQTALLCVLTSAEHQVREHFLYKGKRVFGPHFDVDELARISDRLDVRDQPKEQEEP